MLDLNNGSVIVDDIDIATVPRTTVRAQFNAVPQEAYFVPNTSIRECIDPAALLDDDEIITILKEVRLWEPLGGDDNIAVLDLHLTDGLLSHGQRQLLSIARALVRRVSTGNILLLDEITSHLDVSTEDTIRQVIRRCFSGYTVVSIAHRLETIIDFDIVVVLDAGSVVEVGAPKELLSQATSAFRRLYEKQK